MSMRDVAGATRLIADLPIAGGTVLVRHTRDCADELAGDLSRWATRTAAPALLPHLMKVPGGDRIVMKLMTHRAA